MNIDVGVLSENKKWFFYFHPITYIRVLKILLKNWKSLRIIFANVQRAECQVFRKLRLPTFPLESKKQIWLKRFLLSIPWRRKSAKEQGSMLSTLQILWLNIGKNGVDILTQNWQKVQKTQILVTITLTLVCTIIQADRMYRNLKA
jgi:hypothetical protein